MIHEQYSNLKRQKGIHRICYYHRKQKNRPIKQIWNERRSNGWLWAELLIVFVVLWYIVDWTYATARTYYEPLGDDITNTYYLELSLKNNKRDSYIPREMCIRDSVM